GQACGPDRDRRRSLERHPGSATREPGREGRNTLRRSLREERTMSKITRREWLHRSGGLAVGAGLDSLVGEGSLIGENVRLAGAQGQPKRGGILKVATVDKSVNMDPGYAQLYSSLQVYQNVYNKLVYVDEAGQFVPGLAKSWKQEDDKTWLFDLVDNAVFHNGEPFTAKDVAFTFARI